MLVELHQECLRGDFSSIQRMQAQAATGAAKSQRQVVSTHVFLAIVAGVGVRCQEWELGVGSGLGQHN